MSKRTNETLGMSIEKAICNIYNLENNIRMTRVDANLISTVTPLLKRLLCREKIIKYTGEKGNKVDFVGSSETYSVKTNNKKSEKVCPQSIGQMTKKKFLEYKERLVQTNPKKEEEYLTLVDEDSSPEYKIKAFITVFTKELLEEYYKNLFCCSKLVYIKYNEKKGEEISVKIIEGGKPFSVGNRDISFSRGLDKWNESTTVYLDGVSIGEFQIHNKRDCVKFRFNFTKLMDNIN